MFLKKNTKNKLKRLELIDFSNKFNLKNINFFPTRIKTDFTVSLEKLFNTMEENKALKTLEKIFSILYILYIKNPILKLKKNNTTKNNLNFNLENLTLKISFSDYDKQLDFLLKFFFEEKQNFLLNSITKINKKFVTKTIQLNYLFYDFLILLNNMQIDPSLFNCLKARFWFKTKNKNFVKYLPFF
jgi:hypothetical protein